CPRVSLLVFLAVDRIAPLSTQAVATRHHHSSVVSIFDSSGQSGFRTQYAEDHLGGVAHEWLAPRTNRPCDDRRVSFLCQRGGRSCARSEGWSRDGSTSHLADSWTVARNRRRRPVPTAIQTSSQGYRFDLGGDVAWEANSISIRGRNDKTSGRIGQN